MNNRYSNLENSSTEGKVTLIVRTNSFTKFNKKVIEMDLGQYWKFNFPFEYVSTHSGSDQCDMDPIRMDFKYINLGQKAKYNPYKFVKINLHKGIVKVRNPKRYNFSRYGFVN